MLGHHVWEKALLIRQVEYALLALYQQGHINGTVHTCIGQELTGIAIGECWVDGDYAFSNHRGHGHFIGIHNELEGFFAELLGKESGVCGGHGGSQHLAYQGFFSNGILGSTAPIAAGLAKALKRKKTNNISFLFIGDGALGEGAIYEALNLAGVYQLPLYVICERNHIAQSTPTENMIAGSIEDRASGFGFEFIHSTTNEPELHLQKTADAISSLRHQAKPIFHLVDTQRLMPHSKSDDTRGGKVLSKLWAQDPLAKWINQLDASSAKTLQKKISERIESAVAKSMSAPSSKALNSFTPPSNDDVTIYEEKAIFSDIKLVTKINQTLALLLENPLTILLGEDIESPYGGAFKITDKLSKLYPQQVINTPISEGGVIGLGIGLAMAGYRPIIEIMFGDFLTLGFDLLINSAAKFPQLFNQQISIPLLIRTPMGGRRGYGATHSQSIEKHFLGVPNLQVIAINYRQTTEQLKQAISLISQTTIMVENKLDYTRQSKPMQGYLISHDRREWPCYLISPRCPASITVLCYGGMLKEVEQAAIELLFKYEVAIEIVCPTQLYPFDSSVLMNSLEKTKKIFCVEEGVDFASFTSEVLAEISIQGCYEISRLGADETIISAAKNIEQTQLPNTDKIISHILNWLK